MGIFGSLAESLVHRVFISIVETPTGGGIFTV
jgi:hypothetical protein